LLKKNTIKILVFAVSFIFVSHLNSQTKIKPKDKKSILVFPLVARSVATDWSFGLVGALTTRISKKDTISRTSNFQILGLHTLKKQTVLAIHGSVYFDKEKYILNGQVSYSSFPDNFWGLGKSAADSAEESYKFKQYYIYLHLQKKIANNLFLGSIFEFQKLLEIDYIKGGLFDKQNIIGRNPYQVSGLGLSITYDTRNHAFLPNKGNFVQLYFNSFNSLLGSNFNYTNWVLDARKFIAINNSSTLALQAFMFTNIGNNVPVRSLASLGGHSSMRGFYDGRFKDKSQIVLQSEYRMPVYKRWGITMFASAGDVSNGFSNFGTSEMKFSYGAGLRFALNRKEKLNLRIDYGITNQNTSGLYFQLSEAF
jgi:outer membrane protein assembly factor BamA